jgi:hypothetical protein
MTPEAHARRRVGIPLPLLAWLNVGLHVVGLGLAAAFIRQGSPLLPLADRMTYLATRPIGWGMAWGVWAACAIAMVAFTAAVNSGLGEQAARRALLVAIVAAAVDLTCDGLFAFLLPTLAAVVDISRDSFYLAQRVINMVSLAVANGLYSVSTLLLALAIRRFVARSTFTLGVVVFASGMALAAAGVMESPESVFFAAPVTIGLYCLWVLVVVRGLKIAGVAE